MRLVSRKYGSLWSRCIGKRGGGGGRRRAGGGLIPLHREHEERSRNGKCNLPRRDVPPFFVSLFFFSSSSPRSCARRLYLFFTKASRADVDRISRFLTVKISFASHTPLYRLSRIIFLRGSYVLFSLSPCLCFSRSLALSRGPTITRATARISTVIRFIG